MKICENCGETFRPHRKDRPNRFCGVECRRKFEAVKKRECLTCKLTFTPKKSTQKYCSRSCSARMNNSINPKKQTGPYSTENRSCKRCGQNHVRKLSSNMVFCSIACKNEDQFDNWLGGSKLWDGSWQTQFPKWAKQILLSRSGYQCESIRSDTGERCTESRLKYNGSSVLEVDHIDGNAENNHPNNIRLLCPTCHSLTDTHRAGNWGKSARKWRKVDTAAL